MVACAVGSVACHRWRLPGSSLAQCALIGRRTGSRQPAACSVPLRSRSYIKPSCTPVSRRQKNPAGPLPTPVRSPRSHGKSRKEQTWRCVSSCIHPLMRRSVLFVEIDHPLIVPTYNAYTEGTNEPCPHPSLHRKKHRPISVPQNDRSRIHMRKPWTTTFRLHSALHPSFGPYIA